jgi:hypothetical protein
MDFWVYENWVHRYAKVHEADCPHCNHGHGTHGAIDSGAGRWRGPYRTLARADEVAMATGKVASHCYFCSPSERAENDLGALLRASSREASVSQGVDASSEV